MAERVVSITRVIEAPPEAILDLLADPSRHAEIDGSEMVQASRGAPARLTLGSKFGMDMKLGPLPYRITNTVVEFEENRLIAWQHFGRHRWRYELVPTEVDGGPATEVTESFDNRTSKIGKFFEKVGVADQNAAGITETLSRLAARYETSG